MNDTIGGKKCWFCGKRPAQSGALVQVKMSKVAGRSALGRSRRVDYNTKKVLIPRCSSCKSIHDKAKVACPPKRSPVLVLGWKGTAS